MTTYRQQIDPNRIPTHVAIIMDGNGRWAKQQGKERIFGHHEGVDSVDKVMMEAVRVGVKYLTLYAFSTENWNRPQSEVDALMEIFVDALSQYKPKMLENGVKLLVIGDLDRLNERTRSKMDSVMTETADGQNMTLVLCISYSSRWEITNAVKKIAQKVQNGELDARKIDESTISGNLCTAGIPDPDLLVRTSGELRISNFLMWQLSYSELYFTDKCWPDFKEEEFCKALIDYQKRERRFGKTSEQLKK